MKKLTTILATAMLVAGIGTSVVAKHKSNLSSIVNKEVKSWTDFNHREESNKFEEYMRDRFYFEDKTRNASLQIINEKSDKVLKSRVDRFSGENEVKLFLLYGFVLLPLGVYAFINLLHESLNKYERFATKRWCPDKIIRGQVLKKKFYAPMDVEAIWETYSYFKGGLDKLDLVVETEQGDKRIITFYYKTGADSYKTARKLNKSLKTGDEAEFYVRENDECDCYFGISGVKVQVFSNNSKRGRIIQ